MGFIPILNETTKYLGEKTFYHNNIDINEWFMNDKVDLVQKLAIQFAFFFSSEDNKDKKPEDRIYTQNTYLAESFGVYRESIQSVLLKMEQMDLIRRQFHNTQGEWIDNNDGDHGLTKRRIILNLPKLKDLLSTLPNEIKDSGYEPRSKERRFIARRPISIISDVVNSIIRTQVKDINNRKRQLSEGLLRKQNKQYGNFSNVLTGAELEAAIKHDLEDKDKAILLDHISLILRGKPEELLTAINDGQ